MWYLPFIAVQCLDCVKFNNHNNRFNKCKTDIQYGTRQGMIHNKTKLQETTPGTSGKGGSMQHEKN